MATEMNSDITLNKPLPVKKVFITIGATEYSYDNLLADSNVIIDPVTQPDGLGGQRQILFKIKASVYLNRFDESFEQSHIASILTNSMSEHSKVVFQLGSSDDTRVANEGKEFLIFNDGLSLNINFQSANKFMKTGLIFQGVFARNANIYSDSYA